MKKRLFVLILMVALVFTMTSAVWAGPFDEELAGSIGSDDLHFTTPDGPVGPGEHPGWIQALIHARVPRDADGH